MEQIKVLGIRVTSARLGELHREISRMIAEGRKGFVLYANVHGFNVAYKSKWLTDFYNRADLVNCDGAGIIIGARILGKHIPERITYADWGWTLGEYCAKKGHSLYFLGGPEGVTDRAAENLKEKIPDINISGTFHGYFQKQGPENDAVIARINQAKPDILLVGMGIGMQEKWLLENYEKIDAKVFMVCGAAFRYWAGWYARCPKWMADNGLEWLFRFLLEPRRLAKRYLLGNPLFMIRILAERLKMKHSQEN